MERTSELEVYEKCDLGSPSRRDGSESRSSVGIEQIQFDSFQKRTSKTVRSCTFQRGVWAFHFYFSPFTEFRGLVSVGTRFTTTTIVQSAFQEKVQHWQTPCPAVRASISIFASLAMKIVFPRTLLVTKI